MASLYWTTGTNSRFLHNPNYVLYENRILGAIRLRQVRGVGDECTIVKQFKDDFDKCFDKYKLGNEDKKAFGPHDSSNLTARASNACAIHTV